MVGPVVHLGASKLRAAACVGLCLAASLATSKAGAQAEAADASPPSDSPRLVIRAHDESGPAPAAAPSERTEPARKGAATKRPKSARGGDPDPDASAKPRHDRSIRITIISGYGLELDPGVTGVNPFGVSFGVRGGYTLGPVYLGTRFLFFVGETRVLSDDTEQSADEWLLGFEGGYGFRAGPLELRPELGLGLAISSSEGARAGAAEASMPVPVDTSSEDPYLELGVVLELDLSRRLVLGVEARSTLVLGKQTARADAELFALVLLGTVGYRF